MGCTTSQSAASPPSAPNAKPVTAQHEAGTLQPHTVQTSVPIETESPHHDTKEAVLSVSAVDTAHHDVDVGAIRVIMSQQTSSATDEPDVELSTTAVGLSFIEAEADTEMQPPQPAPQGNAQRKWISATVWHVPDHAIGDAAHTAAASGRLGSSAMDYMRQTSLGGAKLRVATGRCPMPSVDTGTMSGAAGESYDDFRFSSAFSSGDGRVTPTPRTRMDRFYSRLHSSMEPIDWFGDGE